MTPSRPPATSLAPREIADLVYRCCRVAGVDSGNAQRCGANVMHAAIHRAQGVDAFLRAVAGGPSAVTAFANASVAIEMAEASQEPAMFTTPTAISAISDALWAAALRGRGTAACTDTTSASEQVVTVELAAATLSARRQLEADERELQAMRRGVPVDSERVRELTECAAAFLVSEEVVDAAHAAG